VPELALISEPRLERQERELKNMTVSPAKLDERASDQNQHARAWSVLLVAGVFEIGYAVSTGGSHGFTDLGWSLATVVFFFSTVFTLSLALKGIDVGVGYAVWTGIGASGAAVASAILFDQPLTLPRFLWLAVIITGIVVLKLASSPDQPSSPELDSMEHEHPVPPKGTAPQR
jgi:quaternary ammonium compound-resistance protein SugE